MQIFAKIYRFGETVSKDGHYTICRIHLGKQIWDSFFVHENSYLKHPKLSIILKRREGGARIMKGVKMNKVFFCCRQLAKFWILRGFCLYDMLFWPHALHAHTLPSCPIIQSNSLSQFSNNFPNSSALLPFPILWQLSQFFHNAPLPKSLATFPILLQWSPSQFSSNFPNSFAMLPFPISSNFPNSFAMLPFPILQHLFQFLCKCSLPNLQQLSQFFRKCSLPNLKQLSQFFCNAPLPNSLATFPILLLGSLSQLSGNFPNFSAMLPFPILRQLSKFFLCLPQLSGHSFFYFYRSLCNSCFT